MCYLIICNLLSLFPESVMSVCIHQTEGQGMRNAPIPYFCRGS